MADALTEYSFLEQTENHIHVKFSIPHKVVSSAVLNGGIVQADRLINVKVPKTSQSTEAPAVMLSKYCEKAHWNGITVGMMTAASMDSFRMTRITEQGIDILVLVTCGLSNARRVGDTAEYRLMETNPGEKGTINMVVITSAKLAEAACIEALLIATEAKTAVLQEAGVISPVSNKLATGTGTDSIAVVCGHGAGYVQYCGKHVLFGELLGKAVMDSLASALQWEIDTNPRRYTQKA